MARNQPDPEKRQIRVVAAVIIATMVLWMGASVLGGQLGLEARYAFLIDLAALAAFAWALVVLFWTWRRRRDEKD